MIHSALKQRTRNFHSSLETKLSLLLSEGISIDQYAAVQKKFYGFYRPVERHIFSIGGWDGPELRLLSRLKLSLLIRDLIALSVDPEDIEKLPLCRKLPHLDTVPEALGCLYVLEGSTLGGQVIASHLRRVLPIDEARGCSFFNSYGADVGRMWSTFLGVLTRHCDRQGDGAVVLDSACETFASLDRWLSRAA